MSALAAADEQFSIRVILLGTPLRLSVPPRVRDTVGQALELLVGSGAPLGPDAPAHDLTVVETDDGFAAVAPGGQLLADASPIAVSIALLTWAAVGASPRLCVHAGVVSHPGGALVIPGHSGHGKTTLVGALLQCGFGYISDEVLAVDRTDRTLAPFRRPLSLNHDVWTVLGLPASELPPAGTEVAVDHRRLGRLGTADHVADIVLTRRTGRTASIDRVPRGAAVEPLVSSCFNHFVAPESSFRTIAAIARNANVWLAEYRDAPELASLLATRFGT